MRTSLTRQSCPSAGHCGANQKSMGERSPDTTAGSHLDLNATDGGPRADTGSDRTRRALFLTLNEALPGGSRSLHRVITGGGVGRCDPYIVKRSLRMVDSAQTA
jgi:hypothetical protein